MTSTERKAESVPAAAGAADGPRISETGGSNPAAESVGAGRWTAPARARSVTPRLLGFRPAGASACESAGSGDSVNRAVSRPGTGSRRVGTRGRVRFRFTFLELSIALAIFLLVASVLVMFSREVTKSWGRLQREQARFAELMALDRTLDTMLSNLVPFEWDDPEGTPVRVFAGESERMLLTCLHQLNSLADGALRFVLLTVRDDQFVAVYQARPFLAPGEESMAARVSVLAGGVEAVEFLYADCDEEGVLEWYTAWDPERQALPLATLVTVHWLDGRTESWLRRTAGSGFRERWGKWEPNRET